MKDGAAIRLTDPYGIRYTATISQDDYDTIASTYTTVEYGMLICPTDLLVGKTLDFDTSDGLVPGNAAAGQVEFGYVAATPVLDESTETYTLKGSLIGIKEENLSRPFTGRAYIKATDANGAVSYAYTGEESRAIYTVATYAVNDPNEEKQAKLDAVVAGVAQTPRAYLNSVIDKVQSVYGNPEITVTSSNAETNDYNILNGGDTIKVSATVSKTVGGVTRTLDACPTITAQENSGITLEQTSPTEYTVRGFNKTGYNLNATIGTGTNKLSALAFDENVQSWQNEITLADIGEPWLNAGNAATLTPVEATEGDLVGAYHWTGYNRFGVKTNVTNKLEVGDRVVFDIYANDGVIMVWNFNGSGDMYPYSINSSKQYGTVTKDGVDLFSFRTIDPATGEQITANATTYKNKWLTYEITILKVPTDSIMNITYLETGNFSVANCLYVRNLQVLKYTNEATVALADGVVIDQENPYEFLTPINIGAVEVTDNRGVVKTLPATATGGYVEDGVLYTGLGTQTITVKAKGLEDGLEYTINGPTSGTILDGEATKSNIVLGANASMTYEQMYALNQNAWVVGNNNVDSNYNDPMHTASNWHEKSDGITFSNAVAAFAQANTYLYVELYAPSAFALSYYNNGIRLVYSATSGGQWAFYNANGVAFESGNALANGNEKCTKQWVTLELKITTAWNVETDGLSALSTQFDGKMRLGKITLSQTKMTVPAISLVEQPSITDQAYFAQGSKTSLVKSKDTGFTDAYYYSITEHTTTNEDRAFGWMSTDIKNEIVKDGGYMYISVYKPAQFLLCLMGCGDAHYLYLAASGSSATSGISWQTYVYDEQGNPQKATADASGRWITYEFKFSAASVKNLASQFYFFKLPNEVHDKDFGIYVKDFTWSATQQTAFANAA